MPKPGNKNNFLNFLNEVKLRLSLAANMTEGLERLKRKRSTIRTATTKLLTRLEDEVGKESPDMDRLREFLSVLSSKEEILLDLDKRIEDETSIEDLDTEITNSQDYTDRILIWKVRTTNVIGLQETATDTLRARVSDVNNGSFSSQSKQTVKTAQTNDNQV